MYCQPPRECTTSCWKASPLMADPNVAPGGNVSAEASTTVSSSLESLTSANVGMAASKKMARPTRNRCVRLTACGLEHDMRCLDVEAEFEHIAVLDDVVLPLNAEPSGLARLGEGAELHQLLVGGAFGRDEPAFEVGMDHACGRRGLVAGVDRPGA